MELYWLLLLLHFPLGSIYLLLNEKIGGYVSYSLKRIILIQL